MSFILVEQLESDDTEAFKKIVKAVHKSEEEENVQFRGRTGTGRRPDRRKDAVAQKLISECRVLILAR